MDEIKSTIPQASGTPTAGERMLEKLVESQSQLADGMKRLEAKVAPVDELVRVIGNLDEALRGDQKGKTPGLFARADKLEDVAKDHEGRLIHVEDGQKLHAAAITKVEGEAKKVADDLAAYKLEKKESFGRGWGVFIVVMAAVISFVSNAIFKFVEFMMKGTPHG